MTEVIQDDQLWQLAKAIHVTKAFDLRVNRSCRKRTVPESCVIDESTPRADGRTWISLRTGVRTLPALDEADRPSAHQGEKLQYSAEQVVLYVMEARRLVWCK